MYICICTCVYIYNPNISQSSTVAGRYAWLSQHPENLRQLVPSCSSKLVNLPKLS
jgi:hypothetical protein